jgi:hypothetical protein
MGACSSCNRGKASRPAVLTRDDSSLKRLFFKGVELPAGSRQLDLDALESFFSAQADAKLTDIPRALRFLRARGHRVEDALALWRLDQEWRASERIGHIVSEPVDASVEAVINRLYQPLCLSGRARDGRLVMYRRLGDIDLEVLKEHDHVGLDDLVRRHTREMERLRLAMDADDVGVGPLGGHLSILDLQGTSLVKFVAARNFWQKIGALDGSHYAEMLGKLLIINPPALTQWALGTVRPFLDPVTSAKIIVKDGNPQSFLHDYVSPEHLPPHLRPSDAGLAVTSTRATRVSMPPMSRLKPQSRAASRV